MKRGTRTGVGYTSTKKGGKRRWPGGRTPTPVDPTPSRKKTAGASVRKKAR